MSEDHEIQIISKSTIKVESTAPINLTPWDLELLFLKYSQKGLLFHKPTPPEEATLTAKTGTNSIIHHLKASLQRTLHFFPPLAGRLVATSSHGTAATCFSIEGGGGALFIHANKNKFTVADIIHPTHVPEVVGSFFPLNGVRNYDGVSQPLLAVQVTELADGFFIGCSINHLLADGTSFWHFFNSWAEISRGKIDHPISALPVLDRDRVNLDLAGSSSVNIPDEYLIPNDNNPPANKSPPLRSTIFHLSKESVAKIKARANQETMEESKGKISSLQAVVDHIWRSITRCRFTMDTTTFEIPMGARRRLSPPLPEAYFGNAVFPGVVTLEAEKLVQNGLGWAALQINKMVASNSGPDTVREFYMGWIKKPDFLQFDGRSSNHFVLINSPRFNVYGNDFGWGKPVAVRDGRSNSFDGRITISQGLEEGSMDIETCLLLETSSKLGEDAEFMEFVTLK